MLSSTFTVVMLSVTMLSVITMLCVIMLKLIFLTVLTPVVHYLQYKSPLTLKIMILLLKTLHNDVNFNKGNLNDATNITQSHLML
jgi:hypothetical protein